MVLNKIRRLESLQRRDFNDRIKLVANYELPAIPDWGAIAAYRDENGTVKVAGAEPREFWVSSIRGSQLEIFFEGAVRVQNHGLSVDTNYYLSPTDLGTLVLDASSLENKMPALYVIDNNQILFYRELSGLLPMSVPGAVEETLENIGTAQPPQSAIATSVVREILPESGIRKRVSVTNNSVAAGEYILIELNGDASLTQGIIIDPSETWESPGREEARSRITLISGSGNAIDVSYRDVIETIFSIGSVVTNSSGDNFVNLTYPITLINLTAPLSSMKVDLFEEGVSDAIGTATFTIGLNPQATIEAVFNSINGFDRNDSPKDFYIVVKGNSTEAESPPDPS